MEGSLTTNINILSSTTPVPGFSLDADAMFYYVDHVLAFPYRKQLQSNSVQNGIRGRLPVFGTLTSGYKITAI